MTEFVYLMDYLTLKHIMEEEGVFGLLAHFDRAIEGLPEEEPDRDTLRLLRKAIWLSVPLLSVYPESFFQCLWNLCWWHDCPDLETFVKVPAGGWADDEPPWQRPAPKLHKLLERWRTFRVQHEPEALWVRSLRPPIRALSSPLVAEYAFPDDHLGDTFYPYAFGHTTNEVVLCTRGSELVSKESPEGTTGGRQQVTRLIKKWQVAQNQVVPLPASECAVYFDRSISPDGRWELRWETNEASPDSAMSLVRLKDEAIIYTWNPHDKLFQNFTFSEDSCHIIETYTRGVLGVLCLWKLHEPKEGSPSVSLICQFEEEQVFLSIAVLGRSARYIYAGDNYKLFVIDAETGDFCQQEQLPIRFDHLVISDDETLAAVGNGNKILLWSLDETSLSFHHNNKSDRNTTTFSPDGSYLYISPWLWDGVSGRPIKKIDSSSKETGRYNFPLRFVGWERLVAAERGIRTWNLVDGEEHSYWDGTHSGATEPRVFSEHEDMAYSANGRMVACYRRRQKGIELFDLVSQEHHSLDVEVHAAALSYDSRWLVVSQHDGGVRLYDCHKRSWGPHYSLHSSRIYKVICSPHQHVAATISSTDPIKIWDLATGEVRKEVLVTSHYVVDYEALGWEYIYGRDETEQLYPQPEWTGLPAYPRKWKTSFSKEQHGLLLLNATDDPDVQLVYPAGNIDYITPHPRYPIWAGRIIHICIERDSLPDTE